MKAARMLGCGGAGVRGALLLAALVLTLLAGRPASAGLFQHAGHQPAPARPVQSATPEPPPERVLGWEPIRCWRQASAGAVSIGETFSVVLTCAVYEGDNAQVIPDESRLGVASIQLAPFEILGGSHPPDVREGTRRFFQYRYQLRIISRDAIGQDANLPPLTISYRIQSRVGAAATLEGRDLSYVLPMMPIKVLSLVPADASDIRDASEAGLAAVDSLKFRSSVFNALALAFGVLAVATLVLALVPLARSPRATAAADRDRVPDRAVLAHVSKELTEVQSQADGGWTDGLLTRALGLIRIVAAAAIGQTISQKPVPGDGVTPEGRLRVRHGVIRPVSATFSSAVTADDIARARAARGAVFSTTRQQQLDGLQAGLLAMTGALYGREPARDAGAFDEAVRHALGVGNEIAAERSWINTNLRRGFGGQAIWARR